MYVSALCRVFNPEIPCSFTMRCPAGRVRVQAFPTTHRKRRGPAPAALPPGALLLWSLSLGHCLSSLCCSLFTWNIFPLHAFSSQPTVSRFCSFFKVVAPLIHSDFVPCSGSPSSGFALPLCSMYTSIYSLSPCLYFCVLLHINVMCFFCITDYHQLKILFII